MVSHSVRHMQRIQRISVVTIAFGLFISLLGSLPGCESQENTSTQKLSSSSPRPKNTDMSGEVNEDSAQRPLAYLHGRPVRTSDLLPALLEAAGTTVLADHVLDMQLAQALKKRGLAVTQAMADREEAILLASLSADADEAARLLNELKDRRGLGGSRHKALLTRNAALRALVTDQAAAKPETINVLYRLRHGPSVRIRLLVTATAQEAQAMRARSVAGEAFGELAAEHSIDPSASTGGLLSTISLADPSYPVVIRDTAAQLPIDGISPVIALDNAFAIIQTVQKTPADGTPLESVKADLAQRAMLDDERRLMDDLARSLLSQAELVPLDKEVSDAWDLYRQRAQLDNAR